MCRKILNNNKQAQQKQIKSEGAEKTHFCIPYFWCIKVIVDTFGYLKANKTTLTIISN